MHRSPRVCLMSKLVLVIEDDPDQRRFLERMLGASGYRVVTVADGEAALRDASGGKFNIVILKLDEARRLKASVAAGLPDAAILPMEALVTQPVIALAKQEFGRMLVLPATTKEVFSTVEAAYR